MYLKRYSDADILHSSIRMGGGGGGRAPVRPVEPGVIPPPPPTPLPPFRLPPKSSKSLIELSPVTTPRAREFSNNSFTEVKTRRLS